MQQCSAIIRVFARCLSLGTSVVQVQTFIHPERSRILECGQTENPSHLIPPRPSVCCWVVTMFLARPARYAIAWYFINTLVHFRAKRHRLPVPKCQTNTFTFAFLVPSRCAEMIYRGRGMQLVPVVGSHWLVGFIKHLINALFILFC